MLILHLHENRRCSLEDELFILETCRPLEGESIAYAGKKLAAIMEPSKWFVMVRQSYIQFHLRASNGRVFKEPVATLMEVSKYPENSARVTLARDIMGVRSICVG